MYSLINN